MKKICIKTLALTAVTVVFFGMVGIGRVPADTAFSIHIGTQGPPPPQEDYPQWQSPYHTAVWIPGHNEWQNGQYVWVGGYYGYPPHRHSHWVAPRYPHNEGGYSYNPGHWSN